MWGNGDFILDLRQCLTNLHYCIGLYRMWEGKLDMEALWRILTVCVYGIVPWKCSRVLATSTHSSRPGICICWRHRLTLLLVLLSHSATWSAGCRHLTTLAGTHQIILKITNQSRGDYSDSFNGPDMEKKRKVSCLRNIRTHKNLIVIAHIRHFCRYYRQ